MGMKSLIYKAAKTAFKVAGDLKTQVTFRDVIDNGMDDPSLNDLTVDAIMSQFTAVDIRGLMFRDRIQPEDVQLLIIDPRVVKIDMNDKILIGSVEYSVFGYQQDPSKTMWTVGVR